MTFFEILTVTAYLLGGVVAYVLREKAEELSRQGILINKTREEIARDYITKTEVRNDMAVLLNRFDKLEEKLDRLIEGKIRA